MTSTGRRVRISYPNRTRSISRAAGRKNCGVPGRAPAAGAISAELPFAKKKSMEILKAPSATRAEAAARIPAAFEKFYRETYPEIYGAKRAEVERSAAAVLAIFNRNIFPEMKVTWGAYPNNIGHNDFPGCFRCHDDQHASAAGVKVTQDCNACHNLLAMEEASPKILSDLGIEGK